MSGPCEFCVLPINHGLWARQQCHPSPLILAVENAHKDCLMSWIDNGVDINGENILLRQRFLSPSRRRKLPKGMRILLDVGWKVNEIVYGVTALLYAVALGNEDLVHFLLECGAKQVAHNTTINPQHSATVLGYSNILKMLIKAEGVLEYSKLVEKPLIVLTATANQETCATELLKADCNVDARDRSGATALFYSENCNFTKLLLMAGARVNIRDKLWSTPLIYATLHDRCAVVKTLLQHGALVNLKTLLDNTALRAAVSNGCVTCVNSLISYHADLNVIGRYTTSILIEAALYGEAEIVKILLLSKAKINISSNNKLKAMSAKKRNRNEESICLLFAAGEKLYHTTGENVPDLVKYEHQLLDLKHLCRKSIRNHLLAINPNEHLFHRVTKIKLPKIMINYLLYNITLDRDH